jgi:hypothetical protein
MEQMKPVQQQGTGKKKVIVGAAKTGEIESPTSHAR